MDVCYALCVMAYLKPTTANSVLKLLSAHRPRLKTKRSFAVWAENSPTPVVIF